MVVTDQATDIRRSSKRGRRRMPRRMDTGLNIDTGIIRPVRSIMTVAVKYTFI